MYHGFGGLLAFFAFVMFIIALSGGGDCPFLIWVLLVVSGLGFVALLSKAKRT